MIEVVDDARMIETDVSVSTLSFWNKINAK